MGDGNQSNQDSRNHSNRESRADDGEVHLNLTCSRQTIYADCPKRAKHDESREYSTQTAGECEQQAFYNKLTRHLGAGCADRKAGGQFFHAEIRSRQGKVGDVDGSDQQYKCGSPPEEIKGAANASYKHILKAIDAGVKTGIDQKLVELWKASHVCGVDRVYFLLGLFDGRSGFQTSDVAPTVVVPLIVGFLFIGERERYPKSHFRIGELKTSRHHAYNRKRPASHANLLSGHAGVTGIKLLP